MRRAFCDWLRQWPDAGLPSSEIYDLQLQVNGGRDASEVDPDPLDGWMGLLQEEDCRRPARWLLGWLWHCTDVLHPYYTDLLRIPSGSTYGEAVRHIRQCVRDPALDSNLAIVSIEREHSSLVDALRYYLAHLRLGWSLKDAVEAGPEMIDGMPMALLEICETIVESPERVGAASKLEDTYSSALGIEGGCTYLTAASTILQMYDRMYNRAIPELYEDESIMTLAWT
jgi:hypothetical protein